jgi:hypothetical protein
LSNSFEQLAKEDKVVEQVQSRTRITFMDVFEKALSSKGKGIMMVGEGSMVVRGFSLTHELLWISSFGMLGDWICP